MASMDGASPFLGLLVRAQLLNADGSVMVGPGTAYVTKFAEIQVNAELHTGKDIEKEAADGTLCLTAKLPDFQKRKTININFCSDQPELNWLLLGGQMVKASGTELSMGTVTATSGTGGTLAAGTYAYRVTALDAFGESLPSAEATATTTGSSGSVALSWTAVPSASGGYNVYGRTASGETYLGHTATTTYTDTGSATPSLTRQLPTANTTGVVTGWAEPPTGAPGRPNGVSIEFWTGARVGGADATTMATGGGGKYFKHWLPKCKLTLGDRQYASDASDFRVTGFAEPNLGYGTGPGGDFPFSLTAGTTDGLYEFDRRDTLPPLQVGFQAGS